VEAPEPYWSRVGESWERERPQRLWRRHSDAVHARLLQEWLPASFAGRVLKTDVFDEAVSDGLCASLEALPGHPIAMDVSRVIARSARRRLSQSVRVVAADVRRLPFADACFDAVASLSTLDHFSREADLHRALAELRRVLRPGGRLVLTLDNPGNPLVAARNALPEAWRRRSRLVPYFVGATLGARDLGRALEALDFQVEERTALIHAPRVAAVALGGLLERRAGPALQQRFLRVLMGFERMARWPTRQRSGHFVAVRARVPSA
jgi:SAM-dependent methyltransferase